MNKSIASPGVRPKQRMFQRGFTIIEALVALLIMTFGLLAASGMQMTLSSNADVSKQRTEAMRLAQEKMEYLRSYSQLTTATGVVSWAGLASGTDSNTTNATYSRTWSLGGSSSDTHRVVSVAVSWTDRSGESQSITLNSVISKTDPSDTGFLAFPLPENTTLKRVKDRSLDIPLPAIALTGDNAGKSAYNVGSNLAVIFDNYNGNVVKTCPFQVTTSTSSLSSCSTKTAVILAGYVKYRTCSNSNCNSYTDIATTGVDTTSITGNSESITCSYGDATNTSTGATIAGYKYYLCVIPLVDINSSWSGTLRVKGIATTSNYINCRYQYTSSSLSSNEKNVQPYSSVNSSLDNQNYYIATSTTTSNGNTTATCPTIAQSDPSLSTAQATAQAAASSFVLHQNCRSTNTTANKTANCPS
jgi:Tfp pilus assembly protein PilV